MITSKKGEVNYRFDHGYFKCWASINQKVRSKLGFHLIFFGGWGGRTNIYELE